MNRFHTLYSLSVPVLLLSLCLFLLSCAGDDITSTSQNSGDTTMVKLSFCISDGNQTRAINSGNENYVSDITVLVFDNTNSLIGSKYVASVAAGTVDFPVTTRSATGCTIYAIANTGSSSYFAGVNTIDKLNTMYTTIASAEALESSGSTAGSIGAMMIGKASVDITKGAVNKFPITLYHQCSKFSFTIKPASGVTITGYQLCNVPLSSYITDSHVPASASTVAGPPAGASSYGNFTAVSGLSQTTALSKTYYVYENLCGSNNKATSEALRNSSNVPVSASASASYLLINAKGDTWHSSYRVYLGGVDAVDPTKEDLTNFNIYRNRDYVVTVNINGAGQDDSRVSYTSDLVGMFLYSDGSYGVYDDTKTAIGVIFSIQTSAKDKDEHNWTHGYAMALQNTETTYVWSKSTGNPTGSYSPISSTTTYEEAINILANKDGYTETQSIKTTSYPAGYAAVNYVAKNKSGVSVTSLSNKMSGWYLPSVGQFYDMCNNLVGVNGSIYLTGSVIVFPAISDICPSLNASLNILADKGYTVDLFNIGDAYLTSTETGSETIFNVWLYNVSRLSFDGGLHKTYDRRQVRPVIAF